MVLEQSGRALRGDGNMMWGKWSGVCIYVSGASSRMVREQPARRAAFLRSLASRVYLLVPGSAFPCHSNFIGKWILLPEECD